VFRIVKMSFTLMIDRLLFRFRSLFSSLLRVFYTYNCRSESTSVRKLIRVQELGKDYLLFIFMLLLKN
jgi:hypothetical protein